MVNTEAVPRPMKKQLIRIIYIVIISLLSIIFNTGELRCQENSNRINIQYQSKNMEQNTKERTEDDINDDRNMRFEILEWIFKRNLIYKYQKIEPEELEERLEMGR